MSKLDGKIGVWPIKGEAMRYRVESWETPTIPHVVDLSLNHGNGSCSCKDFQTRRWKNIKEGHELFTRETECKHIIAAVKYWSKTTRKHIAEELHAGRTTHE